MSAVRAFVTREVLPVASALEHADTYPSDLVDGMRQMGLFGCLVAPEHGGLGLDILTYARIVEELAAGWMSLTGVLNTHMIVAVLVARHGTEAQRDHLLRPMASGELRGALSLSEPDAGSDTKALRLKARPDGETYVLDGTKMWVTNGERAGLVALAARAPEGITCFLVEKEPGPSSGGITVSKK
ncbi:MAG: acyl-CoA dehydrogenase family protein, partial [Mycobacterium sp.]